MKVCNIALLSSVAFLATTAVPSLAQEFQERPGYTVEDRGDFVANGNRASRIVGMHVRNYQNQDLGRVEDVVFNLQSGRIAYVVLSVPTNEGHKLVAVPPNALLPSAEDHSRLVMNMDRGRLERVQGFTKDNWPDPNRPFVGSETLWGYANPAPPPPPVDYPTYRSDQYRVEQGTAPRYEAYTGTDQYRSVSDRSSFRGRIIAVSPETRTLTVESNSGEVRDFVFADRPNLQLKNNRYPRIVDLKVGFPVTVGYREDPDGTCVAQTVIRTDTPEVK